MKIVYNIQTRRNRLDGDYYVNIETKGAYNHMMETDLTLRSKKVLVTG